MNNTALITINEHDNQMIEMWLHGRSEHTQRAYRSDVDKLVAFTGKSLQETTLYDLQHFADSLTEVSSTSKTRILNSVKSLFSFTHSLGYIPFNVGAALKPPKVRSVLAQRILSEEQVISMIVRTEKPRDHALLRLMYHCGLRVSEVCGLKWSDLVERNEGGQVSVWGKGDKDRNILVSSDMWNELMRLKTLNEEEDSYVFKSRKGGGKLEERQVERIVLEAATRAGIKGNVSPHWLRHSHASHSLDRGANINLVRDTLGHASLATTGKYTHARPNASSSQFLPM